MTEKNGARMSVGVTFDTNSAQKEQKPAYNVPEADRNTPFCIAVLGDFSGQSEANSASQMPLSKQRFVEIDRDNFDARMAAFNIQLNLSLNGEVVPVTINDMDDFHPDELYQKLDSFSQLRSLRRRLKSNATFDDAAAEIQGWAVPEKNSPAPDAAQDVAGKASAGVGNEPVPDNLLDSILGAHTASVSMETSREASQIDSLIRSIVAPYVEPAADPRQDEMVALVDKATEAHMRDILHSTAFQAIESAWASLWFLVKRTETSNRLKIKILDISRQALVDDLAVDDLSASGLYRLFCDPSEGDDPWSALLGNYTFADTIEDILTLANIGGIAQQAGAPFIAAAKETLIGCEAFASSPDYEDWNQPVAEGVSKAWQMLRESPVGVSIGLALPRFLLRLPYGKKSSPVDAFAFEELDETHPHNSYLWGNAAFLKVECMARNFNENGWNMRPETVYQTDNLPVHYYKKGGETVSKPVAEIMLTEKGGEIISRQGLMPVWSVKNSDAIRSSDYRSLAVNSAPLLGRWAKE
ncbi:MAG TPA: hypothetical protein ENJ08_07760 [Gammaproteobacteria bacterium]|nr:hypothetical protein [Gammaproteobacteria bacterium]